MTLPPSIRVNVGAPFPSRVTVAGALQLGKAGGIWNFFLSFLGLAAPPTSINLASLLLLAQNPVGGSFYTLSAGQIYGFGALVSKKIAQGSTYAVQASDGDIVVRGGSAAPTTVNLTSSLSALRNQSIKDANGNASANAITVNAVVNASTTATTNGTNTITVASAVGIAVGQLCAAADIPNYTYVTNVVGTTVTLSQSATGSHVGETMTFGEEIDGAASQSIATDSGSITIYPLPGGGGWYMK